MCYTAQDTETFSMSSSFSTSPFPTKCIGRGTSYYPFIKQAFFEWLLYALLSISSFVFYLVPSFWWSGKVSSFNPSHDSYCDDLVSKRYRQESVLSSLCIVWLCQWTIIHLLYKYKWVSWVRHLSLRQWYVLVYRPDNTAVRDLKISLTQMYFLLSQVLCKFNVSPEPLSPKYQWSDHFHLVALLSRHLACTVAMSGE